MKKIKGILTVVAAVALLIAISNYLTAVNVRVAQIQTINGKVQVQRAGTSEWAAGEVGMRLYEGDMLKTGGSSKVVIQLDDGSTTQLTSLSTMKMEKLSKSIRGKNTNMDIGVGKSWMKVKKMNYEKDRFNVSTPTAVAGVRGTYFSTEVEQTADSTFDVFDGEVSVSQRQDPGQQVYVRSNYRSQVKKGDVPTAPAQIPKDQLQQALADGIQGAGAAAAYDLRIVADPPSLTPGGKSKVTIQFLDNGKPYNGPVSFTLNLGGSAKFVDNGQQSMDVQSNDKGLAVVTVTADSAEQVILNADVQFEEKE